MKNSVIVSRGRRLKANRSNIENTWDLIERYFAPYRGNFFKDDQQEGSIEWRRPYVYDGTGILSSQTLSSSLHSSLTSSSSQFFAFRFRQDALNEDNEAKQWLEESGRRVYEALQDSNFNVEINETYQDLVNYGTSVICEEVTERNGKEELIFSSVPLKECFFEQDAYGDLLNFYRRMDRSGLELWSMFGDDGIPKYIKDAIEGDGYDDDKKYTIWFCIFRRMDVKFNPLSSNKIAELKRPYGYKYVMDNSPDDKLGKEGGYYEMPAFIPRWRKTSDSVWGNSPAMTALSDNLTLQRLIELSMAAIEKAIDPPTLTTNRGLVGDLNLNAGGLTTVRDVKELVPFNSNARFDVQKSEIERLQANVKDYFFINQLMLPPMQPSPATATEITVRVQQLERIFGPTLSRIQTDLLDPALTRTFRILFRGKRLPPMPKIVAELKGDVDIEYVGSLAKSQEATNMVSVERWVSFIANGSQVNQDLLDIPDWDAIGKGSASMLGVPAKFVNSESEIKAERDLRKKQQQAMLAAQMAEQAGKANKALGEGDAALNANQPGAAV